MLMGHLSLLDDIGPDNIGLSRLQERLESGRIQKLILAVNPTVAEEATANNIAEMCAHYGMMASRIALQRAGWRRA